MIPLRGGAERSDMPFDLEAIYRAHHRLIWWVVRSCGVPRATVDDVVQDVFVAANRRRHRAPGGDLRPWLVGIARGVSYNHRRGKLRRGLREGEWLRSRPEETPSIDRSYDAKRQLEEVLSTIDSLEPAQREAFVLVDLHGLDPADVARLSGTNRSTVYSRLRLARERVRATPEAMDRVRRDGTPSERRAQHVWAGVVGSLTRTVGGAWIQTTLWTVSVSLGMAVSLGVVAGMVTRGRQTWPRSAESGARDLSRSTVASATHEGTDSELEQPNVVLPRSLVAAAPDPDPRSTSSSTERVPKIRRPTPSTAASPPPDRLAQEAALLQEVTRRLDRHDLASARPLLIEHAERFADGLLVHERDALQVRLDRLEREAHER